MKKSLLNYTSLFILLMILSSFSVKGQVLYEGFDYTLPGYIGGNGNAGSSSNNWTTHNVTSGQTTTLDLYSGSLSYTGLNTPTGNKVLIFGNTNLTSRDVNRAFTTSSPIIYFSALINIVDNSGVTATGDYFMHIGQTSGTTNTVFGGRLGVKTVNSGSNFRFMIQNTSGGTLTFTEFAQDLNFGTTYLVVVKYDRSTNPTTATLWVNPSSLGGSEPAGSVSNNSGTSTFSAFASICLRNNATTPKAEIDEIYIGETFASVTPGVDVTPPAAVFSPVNSSTNVLVNTVPTITFDESILKTDGSVVTDADLVSLVTFKETDAAGATVAFTAVIDAAKKVITVTPSANLKYSQIYYLAVGPVEDASGNESTLKSVTFTTISATAPTVTLVYPNGGEKLYSGDQATVTWTTTNFDVSENVKLEVYLPDGFWYTIEASTPNDGSQVVNVGPDADYGTYLIRVSGVTNGATDQSDNPFTIIATANNLADLRTYDVNSIIKYTGAATVTYARTADNQKFIQDATAAILIYDPGNYVGAYAVGSGITNVEGKLTIFNGLLELVPQAATGETATGPTITPEPVIITDLTSADQSKLVKLTAVKLAAPTGTWASAANYSLDGVSSSFVIRTAFNEADYIGSPVPGGYFDAVVLVGQFNTVIQVTPRNAADITVYSSQKAITSFVFQSLDPDVTGTIDETGKTVSLTVPAGTDVTTLAPTIAVSANATVSPASGVTTNFTSPVTYTVTAQDGSTQSYTVTVSIILGIEKTSAGDIKLYPVPASSILNVNSVPNLKSVDILDLAGKVIISVTTSTDEVIRIPVSNLRQGTYILRLNTTDGPVIRKFVR